jgi:hypothetical protein
VNVDMAMLVHRKSMIEYSGSLPLPTIAHLVSGYMIAKNGSKGKLIKA